MSWLKPVTTVFAVLTLTTLVWASQSDDEVVEETDAPPAAELEVPAASDAEEAPAESESDFPEDAADFPDDAADFPEDAADFPEEELLDIPEPGRRGAGNRDVKQQLFQLLQREIQRKMGERGRNTRHRGDLERALEQQLRDKMVEMQRSGGFHENVQRDARRPHHPRGGIHQRLEHMRAAVHHLHEAQLHEMAEHVERQADAIQHDLETRRDPHVEYEVEKFAHGEHDEHGDRHHDDAPHHARDEAHHDDRVHDVLRELMEQVEGLRIEVQELREQVGPVENE